jgi:hypothetical protein
MNDWSKTPPLVERQSIAETLRQRPRDRFVVPKRNLLGKET